VSTTTAIGGRDFDIRSWRRLGLRRSGEDGWGDGTRTRPIDDVVLTGASFGVFAVVVVIQRVILQR